MFLNLLEIKMPIGEALSVSLIGIVTVITILAIIALLINIVSRLIRAMEASVNKNKPAASAPAAAAAPTAVAGQSEGSVELIDTDEKEAAAIMAIVSNKSGIPLERLRFKSIRRIDN